MLDFISPDPVDLQARLRPDALACVDLPSGRRWTYREFDRDIRRAVTVLGQGGIRPGDRVAVLARNTVWQLVLHFAAMRMGAIFVPLNWRLSPAEVPPLLTDCTPSILYHDGVQPVPDGGHRSIPIEEFTRAVDAAEAIDGAPSHEADATATILYTSGTSGVPKGVLLTPTFLLATAVNFGRLGEVDSRSVFLCDTPMFHVIGLVTQIWSPLLAGGAVLVSSGFEPKRTNERLADRDLGVTHYFCVPQMADALRYAEGFAPERWETLKALFTGGAPNPPASIRWWLEKGVAMVDGYGMTEAGTVLGMTLDRSILSEKAGSVGLCGPLTGVRLADDEGRDVPDETPGEVLVCGMGVTPGYWNKPEERARAFTSDGWYRTGDIGRRDRDGFVTIVDRKKDMFISGGENVYPVEIEAVLRENPAIREAAVIGVPDERWGEVGRAYVVRAQGAQGGAAELVAFLEARIARYKIPKDIRFVSELPRTASGKIMKHVLRNAADDAH